MIKRHEEGESLEEGLHSQGNPEILSNLRQAHEYLQKNYSFSSYFLIGWDTGYYLGQDN